MTRFRRSVRAASRVLSAVAAIAQLVWVPGAAAVAAPSATVVRPDVADARAEAAWVPLESVFGADRYLTAIAASKAAFPTGAPAVVLATGADWPDALGGAGLAGALGGPVLLTPPDRVRSEVVAEIARLGARDVYVLGGSRAVHDAVLAEVRSALPGVRVTRVDGADRYATASRVASATLGANPAWDGHVFVATGATYADALAAGPVAAALGRPLYLVSERSADAVVAEMRRVGVARVTVLGGPAAVAAGIVSKIESLVGRGNVSRLDGADRFATALAIAAYAEDAAGFTWARPGLATSDAYPDALAAAPLLARRQARWCSRRAPGCPTPSRARCTRAARA